MLYEVITLISITVIVAIRVTAYYQEDLSRDLGKLLPFSLLAIYLTSPVFFSNTGNFFSLEDLQARFNEIPLFSMDIFKFILYAIFVEVFLRIVFVIKRRINRITSYNVCYTKLLRFYFENNNQMGSINRITTDRRTWSG